MNRIVVSRRGEEVEVVEPGIFFFHMLLELLRL